MSEQDLEIEVIYRTGSKAFRHKMDYIDYMKLDEVHAKRITWALQEVDYAFTTAIESLKKGKG